jgi:DNA polymerase-3 subunit alpha
MSDCSHLEGFYYKPRVDWDLMQKHSKGIMALSGCMLGDIPQAVLNGDDGRVNEMIDKFQNTFGKDNFYLEIQYHPELPQQGTVNQKLIQISKEKGIPLVATEDVHYVNPEDNVAQDIMICIQSGKNLDDTNRMSMMDADYSMKDPEVITEAFKDVPEAIENTVKIAERCNVEFDFETNSIPSFPLPDGADPAKYLRDLCYKGLVEKYNIKDSEFRIKNSEFITDNNEVQKLVDMLNYELKIIEDMGFVGYFLIVWDFVKWAKDNEIVVGPGRGSAAGALVSYTLDITEIDPLKYRLLFERFLNPARISMPDIDMDFADNRRDEVIDYVSDKYGRDRVAQFCTF